MTEGEFDRNCRKADGDLDAALDAYFMFEALNDRARTGGPKTWSALQRDAHFWVTYRDHLQTATIIIGARVFDISGDAYSIHRLLRDAEKHFDFFSHDALKLRKERLNLEPKILKNYFVGLPVAERAWIYKLRNALKPHAKRFKDVYQPLRNQVYAHTLVTDRQDIAKLFANTNPADLGECLMKARELVGLLKQMFDNGHEPVLGIMRHDRHRKECAKVVGNVLERLARSRAKLPK